MAETSIIVPVYEVEHYLEKCIDSILRQTYKDFELILIDDGSLDKSGEICDKFQLRDNRVRVIHQRNRGVGATRNEGLKQAQGTYIYFCDPDDNLEPNLLEDNIRLIKETSGNMVIFGYYDEKITDKEVKKIQRNPYKNEYLSECVEFRQRFGELYSLSIMYTLWNKIYKKEFLIKNNCTFDEVEIGEDTRFNLLVYEKLDKVCLNKNNYYHYIVKRSNSAVNKYRYNKFDLRVDETQSLEKLLDLWGLQYKSLYRDLINNEWLITLVIGIKNLFYKGSPFTTEEKKQEINRYRNVENISKAIQQLTIVHYSGSLKEKLKKIIFVNAHLKPVFSILNYIYKS